MTQQEKDVKQYLREIEKARNLFNLFSYRDYLFSLRMFFYAKGYSLLYGTLY